MAVETAEQTTRPRKGFLSRFRRKKRAPQDEKRAPSPDLPPTEASMRDEEELVTEENRYKYPSRAGEVDLPPGVRPSSLPERTQVRLEQAPTARESAFGGPPRYDWIDIVSFVRMMSRFYRQTRG